MLQTHIQKLRVICVQITQLPRYHAAFKIRQLPILFKSTKCKPDFSQLFKIFCLKYCKVKKLSYMSYISFFTYCAIMFRKNSLMSISLKDHLGNFSISRNIVSVRYLSIWWINIFI